MHPLMRIILNGGAGAPWTPSDLTPLRWYPTRTPYIFTDDPPTVVCTAATTARTIKDRSANLVDIVQATAGSRATAGTGAAFLTFDGGDFYSALATGSPAGLFSAHQIKTTTVGYGNVYDDAPSTVMCWIDNNGRVEPDTVTATLYAGNPVITDGLWHTFFIYRSATVGTRLWVDGVERIFGSALTRTIPASITLWNRGGGTGYVGDCTDAIFATSLPSDASLALLQSYFVSVRP